MEKIVKSGFRDCTVTLDGTECSVKFDSCHRAFSVRNDGAADVYISKTSGIVPDADGVVRFKPGGAGVFAPMDIPADTIYLLGTGKVQIHAQNDTICRFKLAPVQSGGGDVSEIAAILGNLSQFFAGENHNLADLINFWIGIGDLKDPKCYPLIPILTSNNGVNGTASCNSDVTFGTPEQAYYAFDGNTTTFIAYTDENVSGGWSKYEFNSPVCVSKMTALVGTGMTDNSFDFHFEYYDDVSDSWVIFGDEMNVSGLNQGSYKKFEAISDVITTSKVRIISNTVKVAHTNWNVFEFQVYGYDV